MTDLLVRRVVVACDAVCEIGPAIEEAAALAARWRVSLHGVFLEDENLFRLAALPFGRQISLLSAAGENLGPEELEQLSAALGNAMRSALAKVAARRGVSWSFGIVRDVPTLSALAGIEGDFLIVESAARPFAGVWRPRSAWDQLGREPARTILLRRGAPVRKGVVLAVVGKDCDPERTLAAAFAMAGDEEEIVILLEAEADVDRETIQQIAKRYAADQGRTFRLDQARADSGGLPQVALRLNPALIVLGPGLVGGDAIRALLTGTHCDVLLMG